MLVACEVDWEFFNCVAGIVGARRAGKCSNIYQAFHFVVRIAALRE
jgi:hypothetical protein